MTTHFLLLLIKVSTKVKEHQIDDASIQRYALSKAIKLNRAYIVHINSKYTREDELDIKELFAIEDITELVQEEQQNIEPNLKEIEEMLNDGDMPDIDIGGHCDHPFSCDFSSHCWKHIPMPSVFNLYRMNWSTKFAMYYEDMIIYDDIPKDFPLTDIQELQAETHKTKQPFVDKRIIEDFLDTIRYPINFFDF